MTSVQSQLLLASAEEGGHPVVNELPFAPVWFGVIALAIFMVLLGMLWTFRNTVGPKPDRAPEGQESPQAHRTASTH